MFEGDLRKLGVFLVAVGAVLLLLAFIFSGAVPAEVLGAFALATALAVLWLIFCGTLLFLIAEL